MAATTKTGVSSPKKQTTAIRPPAPPMPTRPAAPPVRPTQQVEAKPRFAPPSPQAIAEAAYFLWLQRGGNDLDNWLEAEATLRGRSELERFI